MKNDLRFIKGAVSTKDFVPVLKHVCIQDGIAQAFNGSIALSTPINLKENVVPIASDFIKAIELCKDEPQISLTKAGRLKIQDGSFKVFIKCTNAETYPVVKPTGKKIKVKEDLNKVFKALFPFTGADASRPWSAGIIIRNGYAYATNNVVLACYTKPVQLPNELIIPIAAIKELVRIGEDIESVQLDRDTITFHFEGDRWLRTNLIDHKAPDFAQVLSKCTYEKESMQEVPEDLTEILERLYPFMDKKTPTAILRKAGIFTGEKDDGASDGTHSFPLSVFRYEPLHSLSELATHWNFNYYPSPCPFISEDVSGVIIGQRLNHVAE